MGSLISLGVANLLPEEAGFIAGVAYIDMSGFLGLLLLLFLASAAVESFGFLFSIFDILIVL